MRLMLRCCETKEIIKTELPDPCTIEHLNQFLSFRYPNSLLPFSFSLNGVDILQVSSPYTTLQSLGIASGDSLSFCSPEELPAQATDETSGLITLIHAVFEDLSFVSVEGTSGFRVPNSTRSLVYTLPPLVINGVPVNSARIKIQKLQDFIAIYGSLTKSKSPAYRTCMTNQLEVPELMRRIKDNVALPLLIDLSYAANLPLPSCWTVIPTDLKTKIVEMLPGTDVAKMGCVCKEMKEICSKDDIWKRKYVEEFGVAVDMVSPEGWKRRFARSLERHKWETNTAGRRRHLLFRPNIGTAPFPLPRKTRSKFLWW